MATTLQQAVTGVRLRHPAYSSNNVPSRVLSEAYTAIQRRLLQLAVQKRPTYLAQRFGVTFAFNGSNAPGTVGAGTSGGLPGAIDVAGLLQPGESYSGVAAVLDLADAVVLATDRVITVVVNNGNGTTTLTFQGSPAWTVNLYAGMYLDLVAGPGEGPAGLRSIVSNTAGTVTVTGVYVTLPVANQSTGRIIATPATQTDQLAVWTGLPSLTATVGYLVKLDSTGTAYVDLTTPIQSRFVAGITLPPLAKLLGATCVWTGATGNTSGNTTQITTGLGMGDCAIVPYDQRHRPASFPAVYQLGMELFLTGASNDWTGIEGLDIRYSPIPPAFSALATTLAEYFLLPDTAYDCLVAHGALVAARYARDKGIDVDVADARGEAGEAEGAWLRTVMQMGGAERRQTRKNR